MFNNNFYAKEYYCHNMGYDTSIISNVSDIKNSNMYKLETYYILVMLII